MLLPSVEGSVIRFSNFVHLGVSLQTAAGFGLPEATATTPGCPGRLEQLIALAFHAHDARRQAVITVPHDRHQVELAVIDPGPKTHHDRLAGEDADVFDAEVLEKRKAELAVVMGFSRPIPRRRLVPSDPKKSFGLPRNFGLPRIEIDAVVGGLSSHAGAAVPAIRQRVGRRADAFGGDARAVVGVQTEKSPLVSAPRSAPSKAKTRMGRCIGRSRCCGIVCSNVTDGGAAITQIAVGLGSLAGSPERS